MKTNREIAGELYGNYKEALRREEELWERSQIHYERWGELDYEEDDVYEEYEKTYEKYLEAKEETNLFARLVIKYEFEKEGD